MLTKTLKFDEDVLSVIRSMEWDEGGTVGKLIGQLDRKLYERVNKALEVMGGKWNRKVGGHSFSSDPRPQVEGLLTNGALTVERDGFFETPEKVISQMLEFVKILPGMLVLEPSAGRGAIAKKLDALGARVICVEKNEKRADELRKAGFVTVCRDFLDFSPNKNLSPTYYDAILMNPPFEELQDIDHVRHAYELLRNESVMVSVMSESPFFRTDKKSVTFRKWLEEVGGDSYELPEGSFKESGTGVQARLVVIRK